MFLPSCKKRCWCIDGAVGCVPTCPHEAHLPRPDRCPNARLQNVPGRCCDQWTCTSPSGEVFALTMKDFWNSYVDDRDVIPNRQIMGTTEIGNDIPENVIYEDDISENGEQFQFYQNSNLDKYSKMVDEDWHKTNIIPGDIDGWFHFILFFVLLRFVTGIQHKDSLI